MAENASNSNDNDNKNELEKINDTEKKILDIHFSGKTELGKVGRDFNVTR